MIRWSMRPVGDTGKFTVATEIVDGQVRVVVSALDKNDEFLNFLNMTGTVVGPDLKPVPLKMEQTAPGRYVGAFAGREAGQLLPHAQPRAGMAPIRAGVNVPYSDEFRDRDPNEPCWGNWRRWCPKGGAARAAVIDAAAKRRPAGADCWPSMPFATTCPRPRAARTPGIG